MKRSLFEKNKVFVIAEVANSHQGSFEKAKKLIEIASKCKADAIKFQKFFVDELLEKNHEKYSLFKKLEFQDKEWKELIRFSKSKGLKIFFDIFGLKSVRSISKFQIDGYKVHLSDVTNPNVLKFLGETDKPVLLSCGGSYSNEIDEAIKILLKKPKEIILMWGFQNYPTKLKDINFSNFQNLMNRYNLPFGLMDHVEGSSKMALIVPLLGVSNGVTLIEKHLILERKKDQIDYYSSLVPKDFEEMVELIKITKKLYKKPNRQMSNSELKYRLSHKKNAIAKKNIKKNTKLNDSLFEFKRTKLKIESVPYFDFNGKKIKKNIPKNKILSKSLLEDKPKIVAVLACRINSKRLFAKPLQLIKNFPIIHHLIEQIKKATLIDDIVLAISEGQGNQIFVEYAKENNLKFIIGDDKDVLQRLIQGADYVKGDIIVRITSENPFVYWQGIDDLIYHHIKGNNDLSTYANLPLGSSIEIINKRSLEVSHKKGTSKHRSELCTLYINENPKKFKILRMEPPKNISRPEIRLTVDTPQDLWVTRIIHQHLGDKDKPIRLEKIVKFLEKNQIITQINSDIPIEFK